MSPHSTQLYTNIDGAMVKLLVVIIYIYTLQDKRERELQTQITMEQETPLQHI